jgi:hypothetical protein
MPFSALNFFSVRAKAPPEQEVIDEEKRSHASRNRKRSEKDEDSKEA